MIEALFCGLPLVMLIFAVAFAFRPAPERAAKNIKMLGMSGHAKRQFMTQLILALEDPEIRAMLYDAMQEESKLRRDKKQS